LALLLVAGTQVRAQTADDNSSGHAASHVRGWEIGPYVGLGRHSLVDTTLDLGLTPDRDHLFFGLHFTRELADPHHIVIAYAPDVVPVLIITNNPEYVADPVSAYGAREVSRGPVAGFAVSPIGLESRFPVTERWSIFTQGAVGGVWFTRPVPDMFGRRFNFTFEIGSGVRWRHSPRTSWRLGVKFHHLSNAYTAPRNAGIDGAIYMVGLDWAIARRSRE
jgi:hypothetical protein